MVSSTVAVLDCRFPIVDVGAFLPFGRWVIDRFRAPLLVLPRALSAFPSALTFTKGINLWTCLSVLLPNYETCSCPQAKMGSLFKVVRRVVGVLEY